MILHPNDVTFTVFSKTAAKVQQKMHIRKKSEKNMQKNNRFIYFIRYSSLIQARLRMM